MINKFQMQDCKPVGSPMVTGCKLSNTDDSDNVEKKIYISMIDSLLYVTTTRLDAMNQVARFQSSRKASHLLGVKRILRYLKGTIDYGLWYPKGNNLDLYTFIDANWAGCVDDRKSTSWATFYLGGCLVSWSSKEQSAISLSTAEAEYIATANCCTHVIWMKQMLEDIQVPLAFPRTQLCTQKQNIFQLGFIFSESRF